MAVVLYGEGAINVHISLFPGADGGYNMTVTFPEGLASGERGGQPRPQAKPRPRGAQAENWRRRDPAAVPGPKTQPRRPKANVQSSAQSPPAAEPVALAPRQQEGGSNSERKRRIRSATRTARQHLKMAEVAAKTQEAGAPEAPAPTAVGELGAGSHAPLPAPAATATTPAASSCPRLVEATLAETQEAKDVAALAAAARAAAVPATPPPRSLMVTACSPLSGKRGPGPPSWASAGSSGGRSTPLSQDAKRAREEWVREQGFGGEFPYCFRTGDEVYDDDEDMWPSPNRDGPVIPRYIQPLGEAAWCDGIMISRLLRLLRLAAGNDDYIYDKGRYPFFDSLLNGEEPPNTGGGRVFLPQCNLWSSGHTPAPGAPG